MRVREDVVVGDRFGGGLFVVLLLVLRAMPARDGVQGDGGQALVHNPIHDHDPAGLPHWHLHRGSPMTAAGVA